MLKNTSEVCGRTCAALGASSRVRACGAAAIGLAILNSVAVHGAANPEYRVRLVVNTMACWVQHPAQPNLPPYFNAVLKSVSIRVEFEDKSKTDPKLADTMQKEVSRGLSPMQAGPDCRTSADWIVVPQGQGPKFSGVANLLERLLVYQGQSFIIETLPTAGAENANPVPLELRTAYITVYKIQTITIAVNKPSPNLGMPTTVLLEKVWNGTPKGAPERQIPIEIYQSESGCKRPDAAQISERTASAVARLYEQLYAAGLQINSFSPEVPQKPYKDALDAWGRQAFSSQVTAQFIPLTGELKITGLPVVQGVALSDDFGGKFKYLKDRLSERACGELVGFPLTSEGKATFEYLAEQDPAVKTAVVTNNNGVLTLTITPQPTFAHLNGSAGPSYSNQTGWTGKANVTGQDLIRSESLYDLSNSTQISYQGGGAYQDAAVTFSVTKPSPPPLPHPEFYSLSLGGSFTQNQNDRFGGILPGQTLTVSETQATAGLKLSYDSFSIFDSLEAANLSPAGRKLNRHQILFPIAFGFDRFLATGNHGTYRGSGDLFQVSVSPEYTYTHDFDFQEKKRGWSALIIAATGEYIKGRNASAALGFDRYLAGVTVTAFAGLRSTRQFLFRGQYEVGSLSARGPVVRTFQLGGTQWVPGLQFGEDSGQTLGFAQGEAGIDIPSIMKLFGRTVPPDNYYLKMVYSRASVSQRESVGTVAGLGSGAESFGPAVELGRLKQMFDLTAGYMYSPQSALHTHGTIYVTVTMTDYRMR